MHLDPFELHRPSTVEEAVGLARSFGPEAFDYLAGGTDLLPNYKMHLHTKPHLVALWGIPELGEVAADRVGSMVRLERLVRDAAWGTAYPVVTEAAKEVATPLVRASGTVGGNLLVETRCFFFNQSFPWRESLGFCLKADGDRCHVVPQKTRCYATFSGDLAPAFLALDAAVEVAGPEGRRSVPVAGLYDLNGDGIRRHHLRAGELLVRITLPPESRGLRGTYLKLRVRPAFDFPELGVAGAARFDGDRVATLRLGLGGLETHPRRCDEVTDRLVGAPLTDDRIRSAADEVRRSVRPVHNTFLPADYRKKMAGVYTRRVLERLRSEVGAGPNA